MSYKWEAYSPRLAQTFVFEINPNAGGQGPYASNIAYTSTTAPNGNTIMFQGGNKPMEVQASGILLSQAQYDMFVFFVQSKLLFKLTDDRGTEKWVYFTSFDPKRARKRKHPWYHTYTLSYTEVNGS